MIDEKKAVCVVLLAAAALTGYFWYTQGTDSPEITLAEMSVGNSFDPYRHWIHTSPGSWVHPFPKTIGANCLAQPVQTQDEGLALRGVDVNGDSCAQR